MNDVIERLDAEIRRGTFGTITSVVAAQRGRILHEAYFEGDAQTLRNTRSATKTVAGMLVGLAIERGDIAGVDAPLVSFFEEESDGAFVAVGEPVDTINIGAASIKANTALHEALQAAFDAIVEDGRYGDILAEWNFEALDIANA